MVRCSQCRLEQASLGRECFFDVRDELLDAEGGRLRSGGGESGVRGTSCRSYFTAAGSSMRRPCGRRHTAGKSTSRGRGSTWRPREVLGESAVLVRPVRCVIRVGTKISSPASIDVRARTTMTSPYVDQRAFAAHAWSKSEART